MGVSNGSHGENLEEGEQSPAGVTDGAKLQHTAIEQGELQGAMRLSSRSPGSCGAEQRKAGPFPQRRHFFNPAVA